MESLKYHVVITGGGASGGSFFHNFFKYWEKANIKSSISLEFTIIERNTKLGPGLPYDRERNGDCLLHVPPHVVYLDTDNHDGFYQFLSTKNRFENLRESLKSTSPDLYEIYQKLERNEAYPRFWFGYYLEKMFKKNIKKAKKLGFTVNVLLGYDVTDCVSDQGKISLTAKNVQTGEINNIDNISKLFLSVGVWNKISARCTISDRFISKVVPYDQFKDSKFSGKRIGILGSSLTAVDVLTQIFSANGTFQFSPDCKDWRYLPHDNNPVHVTLLSPSGRLPHVYANLANRPNKYFNKQNINDLLTKYQHVPLDAFLELINKDLTDIYNKPYTIQDVIKENEGPTTQENLSNDLEISEKGDLPDGSHGGRTVYFNNDWFILFVLGYLTSEDLSEYLAKTWGTIVKYTNDIPKISGSRILSLLKSSVLDIKQLATTYEVQEDTNCLIIKANEQLLYTFDYIIDCRGFTLDVLESDCDLMKSLYQTGRARDYVPKIQNSECKAVSRKGIDVDHLNDFMLYGGEGNLQKGIYYTGSGINSILAGSALPTQAQIADKVAKKIVEEIQKLS
jgi:uncharacterized NAD(P)/FAD-binding protein YdhS